MIHKIELVKKTQTKREREIVHQRIEEKTKTKRFRLYSIMVNGKMNNIIDVCKVELRIYVIRKKFYFFNTIFCVTVFVEAVQRAALVSERKFLRMNEIKFHLEIDNNMIERLKHSVFHNKLWCEKVFDIFSN